MKTIFTLAFVCVTSLLMAQTSFKTAINTSSQSGYSDIFDIVQLNDGSYVGVGTNDATSENGKILLVKLNTEGTVISSTVISSGDQTDDEGVSIIKTSDGGFAIGGDLGDSMAILRFNSNLVLQWQKQYDVSGAGSEGTRLIQTSDGGFIIVGDVYNEDDSTAGYLVKTDSQGNYSFSRQYGGFGDNILVDIAATKDGNYALLQTSGDIDDLTADSSSLIKIKPDGTILWTSRINTGGNGQFPVSLLQASDGGLVVAGNLEVPYTIFGDTLSFVQIMMSKFSSSGSLLWAKKVATPGSSLSFGIGYGVAEDKDGGYIFGGELAKTDSSFVLDTSYSYLIKLSSSGNLVWTKTFDNSINDVNSGIFYSIFSTSDGGFVVSGDGYEAAGDAFNYSGTVYKFNSNGEICGETGSDGTIEDVGTGGISSNSFTGSLTSSAKSIAVTTSPLGSGFNICNALPVHLLSFNAALQNKSVNIEWTTANEVNTDYFIVERSSNGTSFTALQTVAAKGNSSNVQTYSTSDLQPMPGTSYYRLKQVDKDGSFTYSNIVLVKVLANEAIIISPNPVQDNIRILLQSASHSQATLLVMDMTGKTLATQVTNLTEGSNTITIPASSLSKGLYVLKVIQAGSLQSVRFIKN